MPSSAYLLRVPKVGSVILCKAWNDDPSFAYD